MILRARDIRLNYNGKAVLKGCSQDFDLPGIYVLTGENGSGKSTFLRICALLEQPSSGTVEYSEGGATLPKDITLRRRITLVLPRVGLFNSTAMDNVAYGLKLRALPREVIARKATEALEFVGLAHKANQNALSLSSGEAQRLGIARALALEPDILLLDEPTASVDKKNVSAIEEVILHIKSTRRTIIMTTHDEAQAMRLGDKVLRMNEGAIV